MDKPDAALVCGIALPVVCKLRIGCSCGAPLSLLSLPRLGKSAFPPMAVLGTGVPDRCHLLPLVEREEYVGWSVGIGNTVLVLIGTCVLARRDDDILPSVSGTSEVRPHRLFATACTSLGVLGNSNGTNRGMLPALPASGVSGQDADTDVPVADSGRQCLHRAMDSLTTATAGCAAAHPTDRDFFFSGSFVYFNAEPLIELLFYCYIDNACFIDHL